MRILHLSSEYPPQPVFGLGRFVRDLAEEQARQGHDVTVLTNSMAGMHYDCQQNSVRVCRVEYPPPPKPDSTMAQVCIFNILLLKRAVSLGFDSLKACDVYCSHDWLTAPATQSLSRAFGVPHIYTLHDTHLGKRLGHCGEFEDLAAVAVERNAMMCADHIIANSNATREEATSKYGIKSNRISVVPCAIAPKSFSTTEDSYRLSSFRSALLECNGCLILYVGRLDSEKGVDVLIKAFAAAKIPGSQLVLAGTGLLQCELHSLACTLGIEKNVTFLGYIEQPVLAHLYRVADIFVCPSLYEPFGMVVLEAMLQGVPVIATNIGGLKEIIIHNKNGLLFDKSNDLKLAELLNLLWRAPELRIQLGSAGREDVLENRTWTQACKETIDVYVKNSSSLDPIEQVMTQELVIDSTDIETIESEQAFLVRQIRGSKIEVICRAFSEASRLLAYANNIPNRIVTHHWSEVLSAIVLESSGSDTSKIYFHRQALRVQDSDYDSAMVAWAENRCTAETRMPVSLQDSSATSSKSNTAATSNTIIKHAFCDENDDLISIVLDLADRESVAVAVRTIRYCTKIEAIGFLIIVTNEIDDAFEPKLLELELERVTCVSATRSPQLHNALIHASDLVILLNRASLQTLNALRRTKAHIRAEMQVSPQINACNIPHDVIAKHNVPLFVMELTEDAPENQNSPKDIILYNNWGIGDELLLSAVARELRRTYSSLNIWIESRFGFSFPRFSNEIKPPPTAVRVETIYQNPVLYGPEYHNPFPGHLVQQMLDKVALETGWHVRAENCEPLVQLKHVKRREDSKRIIVHCRPNKRLPSKDWGLKRWKELCLLLSSAGWEVAQVGAIDDPFLPGAQDLRGTSVAELPDLIHQSRIVICLVGFLMHVAAAVNTPAIVIYGGREHPAIDGYPNQIHLSSNPLSCRGRWGCHLAPDKACSYEMKCMHGIEPEGLVGIVEMMLGNSEESTQ
jgi:glycogen synthase